MKPINIFLADDHKILRDTLRIYLSQEQGVCVVGEAANGVDAYNGIMATKPDLAILDISMALLNGLDLSEKLKLELPHLKIIILTMHKTESYVYKALNTGVNGYVLKDNALEDLMNAIYSVQQGKMFLSQDLLEIVVNGYLGDHGSSSQSAVQHGNQSPLSLREREIIQMLAEGNSNKDIAETLHLSIKTVETHRANIMKKLNLKCVADLVMYAVRNQIIEI